MNCSKRLIVRLFVAVLCLAAVFQAEAYSMNSVSDNSALSGFVKDASNKETLIGATVYLQGTKFGSRTNKNGYFTINGIAPGKYTVIVSFLGFEKLQTEMQFKKGEPIRKDFILKPADFTTGVVSVEAEREVEKRQITISKINIPVETIKEIRIGGESDVFRSLQYLPGILTSSQISSGLYIRGGSPDQNLVLLDGSAVYNPTHLFGFISTFNTDAIKDVELVKGGFEAQYGGRLSAVLNLTQKDGNREEFSGIASIGAISSRAALEGPIGNGSWFISGRRTYFELIKAALPDDPENPLPDFNFYDLNAKITQDFGNDDKLSLSGFMSKDRLDYESFGVNMGLELGNQLAAAKWTHIFSNELFATVNLSGSKYFNNFKGDQSGYQFLIENSITDYTGKIGLEWFVSDKLTAKFGTEITQYKFDYLQNFTGDTDSTKSGSSGGTLNMTVKDWNYAAYAQANYQISDLLSAQAGLRTSYYKQADDFLIDPRLALRYQLFENVALKGAWGIFHQNLRLATQQDFSFFDTWLPTDSTLVPSQASHYIFSIETSPFEGYDFNFDVYYKSYQNISELNTVAIEGSTVADVFFTGKARSYGMEFFIQKRIGRFTGWAGYALGFIYSQFDSINGGEEFRPKYDRQHDFKLVAQYQLSDSWNMGAAFSFQSGQSYTGATSRLQSVLPGENYGKGKIVPSQRYGLRLPPSHQLNVNVSYLFKSFGLDSKLILDIYNLYNRRDIWFRYYNVRGLETKVEDVKLIPILPTISYEIKF